MLKKLLFLLMILYYSTIVPACSVANAFSTGTGTQPSTIWFNPNLNFAYVLLSGSNKIASYSYNHITGQLKKIINSDVSVEGVEPTFGGTIDSQGKYMYVTNKSSNSVSVFIIDSNSGKLTLIQKVITEPFPYVITLSPDNNFAYISVPSSNKLLMYKINPNGTLDSLITKSNPKSYVSTAIFPFVPQFSPTGNYLYLAGYEENKIIRYKYSKLDGSLILDSNWSLNLEQNLIKPFAILFDSNFKYAFIPSDQKNVMYIYSFNDDQFTLYKEQPYVSTGTTPNTFMQWYIDSQFSYMGNYDDNTITEYHYSGNGKMQILGNINTLIRPIVVRQPPEQNPKHVFVLSRDENCIADYSINTLTGYLEPRFVNIESSVNPVGA